jgi:hypothetical protein
MSNFQKFKSTIREAAIMDLEKGLKDLKDALREDSSISIRFFFVWANIIQPIAIFKKGF